MKNISIFLLGLVFLFACSNEIQVEENLITEESQINVEKVTKDKLNVDSKLKIEIEGMTCVIGCVKTIQSRLTKMNGVFEVEMDFDEERTIDFAIVKFDSKYTNEKLLVDEIQGIAQGIYTVKNTEFLSIDE